MFSTHNLATVRLLFSPSGSREKKRVTNLRPRFTTDFFSRKRKRRNNEQQKIPENESFERFDRIVSEKFLSSSLCFFFFSFLFSSSCCSHEKTRRDSLSSPLLSSIRIPAEYFNDVSSDERPKIYGDERIFFPQIFSHHNASSLCRMNSPSSSSPPSFSLFPSSNNRSRRIKAGNFRRCNSTSLRV